MTEMTPPPAPPMSNNVVVTQLPRSPWKEWLPVITLVLTLAGALLIGGGYIAELKDNTRRIEALEQDAQKRNDLLTQIDVRTARIEAKLEMLTSSDVSRVGRP